MTTRAHWVAIAIALSIPPYLGAAPAGATIRGGDVLSQENWEEARTLLPACVLEHYRRGDYRNDVVDLEAPGLHDVQLPEEFRRAARENRGRYDVDERGTIIDASTKEPVDHLLGLPFPDVEPNDPRAGVKIIWNYFFVQWYRGDTRVVTDVTMLNRGGVERVISTEALQRMYEGSPDTRERKNPLGLLSQQLAVVVSPADLQGIVSLSWRYRGTRHDSTWTYIPGIRHVRAVDPLNRSDGFLGSDLSLDDGAFFDGKPEDFEFRVVGREDQLVMIDPHSVRGDVDIRPADHEEGWRVVWKDVPRIGMDDPAWKGAPWAPIGAALALRPIWVVEASPRDPNYLYERIELRLDAETYQGAWASKYDRAGQLMMCYAVGRNLWYPAGDGSEWIPAGGSIVQFVENVQLDRATAVLFARNDPKRPSDFRVHTDARDFEPVSLVRHGR